MVQVVCPRCQVMLYAPRYATKVLCPRCRKSIPVKEEDKKGPGEDDKSSPES
jgi:uncharacterized Zn finger protein (UPF0148 family)